MNTLMCVCVCVDSPEQGRRGNHDTWPRPGPEALAQSLPHTAGCCSLHTHTESVSRLLLISCVFLFCFLLGERLSGMSPLPHFRTSLDNVTQLEITSFFLGGGGNKYETIFAKRYKLLLSFLDVFFTPFWRNCTSLVKIPVHRLQDAAFGHRRFPHTLFGRRAYTG